MDYGRFQLEHLGPNSSTALGIEGERGLLLPARARPQSLAFHGREHWDLQTPVVVFSLGGLGC